MAAAVAGQFLFGVILALLGTLFGLAPATEHLGLDLEAKARLLLTLFTGQLIFTAIAGRIVDRFGSARVLAAGSLIMAAALVVLAEAEGLGAAMVAAALMSLGGASANAASNVLVSNVYGAQRGPMLSVLGVFGAVGALGVPFVFAGVSTYGQVRARLLAIAAAGVAAAVAQALQPQPPVTRDPAATRGATRAALRDPWVLALSALLLLDFGNESVMAGWIATYTLGAVPGASGTTMVALYWGALVVGRIITPAVLARVSKLRLIAIATIVGVAGFVATAAATSSAVLALTVVCTGLALAPLGPTILSVAGDRYERNTGAVFGVMLSLGQFGGVVTPWLVAQVAASAGFRAALLVPAGAGLVMLGILAMLLARESRGTRSPAPSQAPEVAQ
ncbi:MAG TPA: MFS transporter [Gemmatimonadales bacterium]|nr:MFS transporter [Gemmatimonadales bacterium]